MSIRRLTCSKFCSIRTAGQSRAWSICWRSGISKLHTDRSARSISARLRYEGWLETLAKHAVTPCAVQHGDWSAASGYQQALLLLNQPVRPGAILVANDQMALGVLRAVHEYGLRVPEQISVIGYDDTEDSAFFFPPLTTIKQDFRLLGHESVNRLVDHLHTTAIVAAHLCYCRPLW